MPVQTKKKIRVIKVSSDYPMNDFYTPSFKSMPRLYLELLENKQKVRPDMRNREFIPKGNTRYTGPSIDEARITAQKEMSNELKMNFGEEKRSPTTDQVPQRQSPPVERKLSRPQSKEDTLVDITNLDENKIKELETPRNARNSNDDEYIGVASSKGSIKPSFKERLRQRMKERDKRGSESDEHEPKSLDASSLREKYKNRFSSSSEKPRDDNRDERDDRRDERDERREDRDDRRDERDERRDERDERRDERDERRDERDEQREDRREERREEKREVSGLAKLLRGEKPPSPKETPSTPFVPLAVAAAATKVVSDEFDPKLPPSLEQINKGTVQVDANGIRNIEFTSNTEDDLLKKKRELLNKIKILKKSNRNPNILIPDFTELTDLQTLEREHDHFEKILRVEQNVETYTKVLKYGLLGLEWVLTEFLKFDDIDGFAKQQIANMHQYEPLLMEISEKSYMPDTKSWPVELRLLSTVLMNGAGFVMMKMFFKHMGPKGGQPVHQTPPANTTPIGAFSSGSSAAPRPKMRGPQFDFDDLETKKHN